MRRVVPRSAASTHPGRRPHNEDAHLRDDVLGLYVVADGVGGLAKGEIASRQAVEEVTMWVRRHATALAEALDRGTDESTRDACRIIQSGVENACYMLFAHAEQDPAKKGMSTTLSMLYVHGQHGIVAQVGDSRVYRWRDHEVSQITEDHTLVNLRRKEGKPAPAPRQRNMITRAVGYRDYVNADVTHLPTEPGDRYLLCSDGLYNYVFEAEELDTLLAADSLEASVANAVRLADERGGRDNITALMVEIRQQQA